VERWQEPFPGAWRATSIFNQRVMRGFLALLLFAILGGLLTFPFPAYCEITEQQAIARADQAISKFDVLSPAWSSQVDKAGKAWAMRRSRLKARQNQVVRDEVAKEIAEIEATLVGRAFWTIVYTRNVPPGTKVFDTEALVFVDSTTGAVLSLINQEGGFETSNPKN